MDWKWRIRIDRIGSHESVSWSTVMSKDTGPRIIPILDRAREEATCLDTWLRLGSQHGTASDRKRPRSILSHQRRRGGFPHRLPLGMKSLPRDKCLRIGLDAITPRRSGVRPPDRGGVRAEPARAGSSGHASSRTDVIDDLEILRGDGRVDRSGRAGRGITPAAVRPLVLGTLGHSPAPVSMAIPRSAQWALINSPPPASITPASPWPKTTRTLGLSFLLIRSSTRRTGPRTSTDGQGLRVRPTRTTPRSHRHMLARPRLPDAAAVTWRRDGPGPSSSRLSRWQRDAGPTCPGIPDEPPSRPGNT